MALQQVIDITNEFNSVGYFVQDMGDYNTLIAQFVTPSDPIPLYHTNDSGALIGVTDGNYKSADNFNSLVGFDCSSTDPNANGVVSVNATGIYRFSNFGRFIKFGDGGETAVKIILRLYKI
jgi:hypothetical protein